MVSTEKQSLLQPVTRLAVGQAIAIGHHRMGMWIAITQLQMKNHGPLMQFAALLALLGQLTPLAWAGVDENYNPLPISNAEHLARTDASLAQASMCMKDPPGKHSVVMGCMDKVMALLKNSNAATLEKLNHQMEACVRAKIGWTKNRDLEAKTRAYGMGRLMELVDQDLTVIAPKLGFGYPLTQQEKNLVSNMQRIRPGTNLMAILKKNGATLKKDFQTGFSKFGITMTEEKGFDFSGFDFEKVNDPKSAQTDVIKKMFPKDPGGTVQRIRQIFSKDDFETRNQAVLVGNTMLIPDRFSRNRLGKNKLTLQEYRTQTESILKFIEKLRVDYVESAKKYATWFHSALRAAEIAKNAWLRRDLSDENDPFAVRDLNAKYNAFLYHLNFLSAGYGLESKALNTAISDFQTALVNEGRYSEVAGARVKAGIEVLWGVLATAAIVVTVGYAAPGVATLSSIVGLGEGATAAQGVSTVFQLALFGIGSALVISSIGGVFESAFSAGTSPGSAGFLCLLGDSLGGSVAQTLNWKHAPVYAALGVFLPGGTAAFGEALIKRGLPEVAARLTLFAAMAGLMIVPQKEQLKIAYDEAGRRQFAAAAARKAGRGDLAELLDKSANKIYTNIGYGLFTSIAIPAVVAAKAPITRPQLTTEPVTESPLPPAPAPKTQASKPAAPAEAPPAPAPKAPELPKGTSVQELLAGDKLTPKQKTDLRGLLDTFPEIKGDPIRARIYVEKLLRYTHPGLTGADLIFLSSVNKIGIVRATTLEITGPGKVVSLAQLRVFLENNRSVIRPLLAAFWDVLNLNFPKIRLIEYKTLTEAQSRGLEEKIFNEGFGAARNYLNQELKLDMISKFDTVWNQKLSLAYWPAVAAYISWLLKQELNPNSSANGKDPDSNNHQQWRLSNDHSQEHHLEDQIRAHLLTLDGVTRGVTSERLGALLLGGTKATNSQESELAQSILELIQLTDDLDPGKISKTALIQLAVRYYSQHTRLLKSK